MNSAPEAPPAAGGHRWRWQKRPHGAIEWVAPAPGQLGEDGGTVTVSPPSPHPGRCPSCGRRAHIRVAFLALPVCSPFGPVGQGCSRAHATQSIAAKWSSWTDVSAAHTEAAGELRARADASEWDERTAAYIEHRGQYAAFLAAAPSETARRLALQLWSGDPPRLSVADTATIITGILTEPPEHDGQANARDADAGH
ncbi:hypothetical protein [Blastococcus sp. VKM Ac-2987]|uniref:hypothetical protein n=1 Tax=Blastococcus sp. VKM Ac-2987 TaxID=3004141 RepID=UPI0022AB7863|nr:hypothetical protein [Blastococcus sp. VKM Ac-2987]MCZ2859186.1 hypothetical protein [Blastococcus sp. VKM Ac-2987]